MGWQAVSGWREADGAMKLSDEKQTLTDWVWFLSRDPCTVWEWNATTQQDEQHDWENWQEKSYIGEAEEGVGRTGEPQQIPQ